MKGVTNVVTTSALILITLALLSVVMPWAWNLIVETTNSLTVASKSNEHAILSDVYFFLPTAVNRSGTEQLLFIINSGYITLSDARVKMIDLNFNIYDINFFVIRRGGSVIGYGSYVQVVDLFYPGDVIVGILPNENNYIGYKIIFQSREYSEVFEVAS